MSNKMCKQNVFEVTEAAELFRDRGTKIEKNRARTEI